MSSSPRFLHQALVGSFHLEMALALRGKPCQVYLSPLDVKLSDFNAVQSDLLVLCDRSLIKETHIEGAPNPVVEYWIVTPEPATLEVLVWDAGSYRVTGTLPACPRGRPGPSPQAA